MDRRRLITICQFGGEFEVSNDGTLYYHGGEAHAIDVDYDTRFEDYKLEIAEMLNSTSSDSVSIKYFLPGNRTTLITISNDKDFKRMISFSENSSMLDVFVNAEEIVARDVSIMPGSRSSGTTLADADVPVFVTPLDVQNGTFENVTIEMPVDSAPPVEPLEHHKVPTDWENAITGVNQRFSSVNEFRDQLHKYALAHKFAYKFLKNDPQRVTARCKSESCPWRIHASRLSCTPIFCVKKMTSTHTCEGGVVPLGSHATTNIVAGIVKEKLRDFPGYKPKDIVEDIKREYGLQVNYYQARQAKEMAKGSYEKAYSQLPFLCDKIMETNPGSIATLATKEDSSFDHLFISFDASLHGFQLGCRPLLFLDSLCLKSKYQETLLFATAADGDDGVFPVAFAVVVEETAENWHWFLMELRSAVSGIRTITFVADMEKGLAESISEIFDDGYHSYCLRCLSESFRKDLPKKFSHEVKRLLVADFYTTATALKQEDFQRCAQGINGISPEAYRWITNNKPENWANAYFRGARYNHLTSNFGDSFYNWLSEAQRLPITQLVHMIRGKMMELMYSRKADSSGWTTTLTPSMEEKLKEEASKADSHEIQVSCLTESTFHVRSDTAEEVDIKVCVCSCTVWQITGIPCYHAIAVFNHIDHSAYDYCSQYFTTESYRLAYSRSINPVPNVDKAMQKESSQVTVVVKPPPRRPSTGKKRKRNKKIPENVKVAEQIVDSVTS